MTDAVTVTRELDCRGMSCPLPIIKTRREMDSLAPGDVLKMVATDPGSVNDMAAWARKTGHEMVGTEESGGEFAFYIRKVG
jgi:tRNA 2-thiouridine synthesizing protein A